MSNKIRINIYDKYEDSPKSETFIYIDNRNVDLEKQKLLLTKVLNKLESHLFALIKFELVLFNSEQHYVISDRNKSLHYKQWQIKIFGLSHKRRDTFLQKMESSPNFLILREDEVIFYKKNKNHLKNKQITF